MMKPQLTLLLPILSFLPPSSDAFSIPSMHRSLHLGVSSRLSSKEATEPSPPLKRLSSGSLDCTCSYPTNVRKIVVSSTTGSDLHFFAFRAIDGFRVRDVALGKAASQSSTLRNDSRYAAGNAVDGSVVTFSHTNTESGDAAPSWEVDLEGAFEITAIDVLNRYCGSTDDSLGCLCRLSNATVDLLDGGGASRGVYRFGNTCGVLNPVIDLGTSCGGSAMTTESASSSKEGRLQSSLMEGQQEQAAVIQYSLLGLGVIIAVVLWSHCRLGSRRSEGLQSFAILLACLGFYGLVTNVNPGRLRLFQASYSEGKYGLGDREHRTNSMITCDMAKGVGSCVDPVGVEGEWVLLHPEQPLAAPVCCEWLGMKFLENKEQCGTELLPTDRDAKAWTLKPFRGNPNFYTQTAGCYCSNFTERYVWQSPNLLSHSEFDPIDTCRLLGDREVLFIGDSTSFQTASTLMNTLYPGGCQNQIIAVGSDTLVGLSHDRVNKTWKDWVEEFHRPDIVIVTMGSHVPKTETYCWDNNETIYQNVVDQVLEEMEEMREQYPQTHFAWKTQQPGGCTREILEPTNSTKAAYSVQDIRYNWGQYYARDLYMISRLQTLGMPYLDLRMLYSRSDGHKSSQTNNFDCLHFCHGPLDVIGRVFHQFLSSL